MWTKDTFSFELRLHKYHLSKLAFLKK